MADTLTSEQRKRCMSSNKGKNTSLEIIIRHIVYFLGYRYRLHRNNLPGCPDLVFSNKKKVIFINGCYWHRHKCKKGRSLPKTRKEFWENKFERTIKRDRCNRKKLKALGWKILTVWECELKKIDSLKQKLIKFLEI